jgi:hypothetical protein
MNEKLKSYSPNPQYANVEDYNTQVQPQFECNSCEYQRICKYKEQIDNAIKESKEDDKYLLEVSSDFRYGKLYEFLSIHARCKHYKSNKSTDKESED